MYQDLKGKVAVVTGGSKGIGSAISERFGKEQMKIVINYNSDPTGAKKTAAQVINAGGEAVIVQANIATEDGNQRLLDAAIDNFGDLDIWVNNAGMEIKSPTHETTLEDWNKVTLIDQTGVFLGSRTALAYFVEHNKKRKHY